MPKKTIKVMHTDLDELKPGDVVTKITIGGWDVTVEREVPLPEVRVGDVITYKVDSTAEYLFGPITKVLLGEVYVGESYVPINTKGFTVYRKVEDQ